MKHRFTKKVHRKKRLLALLLWTVPGEDGLISRPWIGNCRLTYHYLLVGEPHLYCHNFMVLLTVMHVLMDCPLLRDLNRRFLGTHRSADVSYLVAYMLGRAAYLCSWVRLGSWLLRIPTLISVNFKFRNNSKDNFKFKNYI